jgi:hypothetical protein
MLRRTFPLTLLMFGSLVGLGTAQSPRRNEVNYPRLRAALHELRDAKGELATSRDVWPAGHKERAMGALNDGIESVRGILAVNDVEKFRGVDRNPEFYKKFKDYPRLRAALGDLREARDELRAATADFGGMKERALDDIEVAIGEIVVMTRERPRR